MRLPTHVLPPIQRVVPIMACIIHCFPGSSQAPTSRAPKPPICPQVEVVFCIDTTGSMNGLIEAAKARVWGIVNGVARSLEGPKLRVGLVAYKDREDEYVTQVLDLTDNLEAVQTRLSQFGANGGGDYPESVNQALSDSVRKVSWSPRDQPVYRVIFLVGDAPPHMDYPDDVKYPESCREARAKGILINTIQCGTNEDTRLEWLKIAQGGGGNFVEIPQSGGVRILVSPYDAWLAEFSGKLLDTARYSGPAAQRSALGDTSRRSREDTRSALERKDAQALAREADRGEFRGKVGLRRESGLGLGAEAGKADLIERYLTSGAEGLRGLNPQELPEDLKALSFEALVARIKELAFEREGLLRQIQDLSEIREAYLDRERAKSPGAAFDEQVLDLIRRQAALFCH